MGCGCAQDARCGLPWVTGLFLPPKAVVFSAVPLNFLCKVPSVYVKLSSKSCEASSGEGWDLLVPLLSPRGCPGGVPSGLL